MDHLHSEKLKKLMIILMKISIKIFITDIWKMLIITRKERRKGNREEKVKRDLNPNFDYTGYNIWVFVSTKGMFYKVTRTTNKRVYFWDEHSQKERFCNFSSVGMVDVR
jgi:hypothetical protein